MKNWKELYEQYWVNGSSFPEIAESIDGMSGSTLRRRFISMGFPVRPRGPRQVSRGLSDEQLGKLIEDIESGTYSHAAIGRKYGLTRQRVSQIASGYRRSV